MTLRRFIPRWCDWAAPFVIIAFCTACGRNVPPPTAPAPRVVRVRIMRAGGMCGGFGYCTFLMTVEPSFVVSEHKDSPYPQKLPNTKTKRAITRKEWEILEHAIDAKALMAVPQTPCHAVVDLPCAWVEVEFSDRTKIEVSYDDRNTPPAVARVLRSLPKVQMELKH